MIMRLGTVGDRVMRTRVGPLVLIRWLAIAGQSVTVCTVQVYAALVPLVPVVAVILASALFNAALAFGGGGMRRLTQGNTTWHIAFDLIQVCVLIGLTGGIQNPFSIFVMGPVAVAAATLPGVHAAAVGGLATVGISAVILWHMPLPWPEPLVVPAMYLLAAWLALVVGIASIAFFTWNMANETRRIDAAYEASRTALLKEQKVAAVGGLAAMVAHELNTPLATVCLVAQEIVGQLSPDNPYLDDMRVLRGQAERCRDILARLSRRHDCDALVERETVPVSTLVEMAATPYRDDRVVMSLVESRSVVGQSSEPWIVRSPEILHGLGNLIQNAVQFAASRVDVLTGWDVHSLTVRIRDDGPGFSERLLEHMGEPYVSTRNHDGQHLGLGVFIASMLLSRTGAQLSFANHDGGGGEVVVSWLLCDLPVARTAEANGG